MLCKQRRMAMNTVIILVARRSGIANKVQYHSAGIHHLPAFDDGMSNPVAIIAVKNRKDTINQ